MSGSNSAVTVDFAPAPFVAPPSARLAGPAPPPTGDAVAPSACDVAARPFPVMTDAAAAVAYGGGGGGGGDVAGAPSTATGRTTGAAAAIALLVAEEPGVATTSGLPNGASVTKAPVVVVVRAPGAGARAGTSALPAAATASGSVVGTSSDMDGRCGNIPGTEPEAAAPGEAAARRAAEAE